jgi:hypothetical protein
MTQQPCHRVWRATVTTTLASVIFVAVDDAVAFWKWRHTEL